MDSSFKDSVLGIPFYRFYYDKSKMDAVYDGVQNLSYRDNDTNWIWSGVKFDGVGGSDLHKLPEFAELFEWLGECMSEVARDLRIPNKIVPNSAFAHVNKTGQFIYDHVHPNCFFSSNYYISGESRDNTVFVYENPYFHKSNIRPCGDGDKEWSEDTYYLVHKEPTEPGKFVVFPPTIRHYSQPNSSRYDRYTIAVNWFPTGLVNCGDVSHLNVEVL